MKKSIHVAVYGTLKGGHENYARHLEGEVPVLAAVARLPYRMYASSEYPMLVPDPNLHPIAIEVYAVSEAKLAELDGLELPYGYRRESTACDALGLDVEIYVHPAPPPAGFELVADGDWKLRT